MYQVFELQRAAFDASVSKMVNEYEKKFVPQAEAISAYDVEIDERTKEIDNSISLIRELIKTELDNCDLMDEVLNYLKIYDHSLVIDARNILNGSDVIVDLVEKDLNIINKTNYDERDNNDTDDDTDNDRPTFIEKDNIDDNEADTRHDLIKDIIDPVAGTEGPLGSKGPVDTDAITEAIKEKNKEEAAAKQKAADEAKTEADAAKAKAEEAERRKREAQEALKEAIDDLVHTMAEAKKLADAGSTIAVITTDTNLDWSAPEAGRAISIDPSKIDEVIRDPEIAQKIHNAIDAATEAIANGATRDEAIQAATEAANKVDEKAHSGIGSWLSDKLTGESPEEREATSELYATSAVNYVENQIAAQEAAAAVPEAVQRLKEAQEKLGEASAEAKELQQAYEQAKQEADVRQAEADAAADSGAENSGGGEGSCDSSCDSTGCDEGTSCDSNPGCDSCTKDGCRRDSCDGSCDCDRDPACGKDGICGSDTCRRETDD